MKTFKLIIMSFIFGIGLLVPAGIASADPCHSDKGKDSISVADAGHHDDDDDKCGTTTTVAPETTVPDTTVVTPTTVPYDLPETGTDTVVMSVVALAAIAAGLVAIYIRRIR